jgi:signal transduction histidine kinase
MASIDSQQLRNTKKMLVIAIMVIGITALHLYISRNYDKSHILAREMYFLPIIVSAFWFGLRGAILTSMIITAFYLPYSLLNWQGFSTDDLNRLLEILLYNIVAITMGILQDRHRARAREKLEVIQALAGTVAHEMNSPLFVAIGNLELLQGDFDQNSEPYLEIENIIKNLKIIKVLIKKISQLESVITKDYDGTSMIVDLDKSSALQG